MDIEEFLLPKRLQGLGFKLRVHGKLDRGMDKLLALLWKSKFRTISSCSGHGVVRGYIDIETFFGRDLTEKQINRIRSILEAAGAKNITIDSTVGRVEFDSMVKR